MTHALSPATLSVNAGAMPLVHRLLAQADALGITATEDSTGITLIDGGLAAPGSIAAGLLVAEICLGGLGEVGIAAGGRHGWPLWIEVHSAQPVLACLGSQYAGWSLAASQEETGGRKFFSLGSGPARALAAREPLFAELGYRDQAEAGVLVLEVDRLPPPFIVDKLLRDTGLAADAFTAIITPTTSATGTTQVVARVLEVALHRAHTLGFNLAHIVEGTASAPLPAPSPDAVVAMGRTNDAILYGGQVQLSVRGSDEDARALARQLPSRNSPDFGKPFAQLFSAAGFDFYQLDPGLFAPAEVWVSNLDTGHTFHSGAIDMPLLHQQWLQAT